VIFWSAGSAHAGETVTPIRTRNERESFFMTASFVRRPRAVVRGV
jgi:hypothetical protein